LAELNPAVPPGLAALVARALAKDPAQRYTDGAELMRALREQAHALTRRLAAEEGLLVGVSSGAALAATLDLAARIQEGIIVTVFPDSGTRYLTESFWQGHISS
jgi:cysteine synthase